MGVIKSVKTVLRGHGAERDRNLGGQEIERADDKEAFAVQPDQAVTYALETKPGSKPRVRTRTIPTKEVLVENSAEPSSDVQAPQDRRSLWVTFGFGRPTRVDLEEYEVDIDDLKKKLMDLYPRHLGHLEAFEFGLMLNSGSTELIPEDMPLDMLTLSNRAATPIYIEIPGDAQGPRVLPLSPVVNPGESSKPPLLKEKQRYNLTWGMQEPKQPHRRHSTAEEELSDGTPRRRRSSFQFDVECVEESSKKAESTSERVDGTIGPPVLADNRPARTHRLSEPLTPNMFPTNPPPPSSSFESLRQQYMQPLSVHPVVRSDSPSNRRPSRGGSPRDRFSPPASPCDYENDIPIPPSVAQPVHSGPTTYPSLRAVHGMPGSSQEHNTKQGEMGTRTKPGHSRESSIGIMFGKSGPPIPRDSKIVISAPQKQAIFTHSLTPDAIYKILENSAAENQTARRAPATHGNLNFVKPLPYHLGKERLVSVAEVDRERRIVSLDIPREPTYKPDEVRDRPRRASMDAPTVKHVVDLEDPPQQQPVGRVPFWGRASRQSRAQQGVQGGRSKGVIAIWRKVFGKRIGAHDRNVETHYSDIQMPESPGVHSPPVWASQAHRQMQR